LAAVLGGALPKKIVKTYPKYILEKYQELILRLDIDLLGNAPPNRAAKARWIAAGIFFLATQPASQPAAQPVFYY
jgi:hypothetical protein